VEDVVTTGGSSLLAAERAIEFGMSVVMVAAIVDRCEGGREAFAARGIAFQSLLSITDFGIAPPQGS
jgi:orotate phosphoribosyltransferase